MKQYRSISLLIVAGLLCPNLLWATIPNNYYNNANHKQGQALLEALYGIIKGHSVVSYGELEHVYPTTDVRSDDKVWDMYSTCDFTFSNANGANGTVCGSWNKEHSLPQSWFSGSSIKSDIFHVYPTDSRVNGARSNYPYGEVSGPNGFGITGNDNNKALGKVGSNTFPGYSGTVFEPVDEYKGDFARTYFYMCARYRDATLNNSNGSHVFTTNPSDLTPFAAALFMKWHRQDPVSQKEIDRNNAIYADFQHNRNPFIDYPYLAEYIWGTKVGTNVDFAIDIISSEDPRFIVDVSDGSMPITDPFLHSTSTQVIFPMVLENEIVSASIQLAAANLTDLIDLTISGDNADYFWADPSTIDADAANGVHEITLFYQPAQIGLHGATLTISSEGADDLILPLNGACASQCAIAWKVDGQDWNYGDPTTAVALGSKPETIPAAPQSCSEESPQFVGWSVNLISGTIDEEPYDLFSDAEDAPEIMENTTFHAVFAHLTTTESELPATVTWQYGGANTGWVDNGTGRNGSQPYVIMQKDASLTSPEINLATLESVTVKVRTYGGTSFNTVTISANGETLGSVSASNTTLTEKTWTNNLDLTGTGSLVFSSSTSEASKGPAISEITITCSGIEYNYNRYMTTCTAEQPTDMQPAHILHSTSVHKFLQGEYLLIEVNDHLYNAQGQRLK